LKEGTKEQENFNVKVVTTRSSIVKERANESTRSDTGENENLIETFFDTTSTDISQFKSFNSTEKEGR
jgi:hypothetical protein